MNIWHDLDPKRVTKKEFIACIEISRGSKNKYELDKETGMLILDRILYTSTHYPANYGFIPRTYCDDRDPLDVLVLCNESIVPLSLVKCKPIGVLKMIDESQNDEKIIAVATNDPLMNSFNDISDLPGHIFDEIIHFFKVYKELEGKHTVVKEVLGKDEAYKSIVNAINLYNEKFINN